MTPQSFKVTILGATNLGPYHLARYRTLVNSGIDLTIVQTPVKEFYRPWQFDEEKANFRLEQPYQELNGDTRWAPLLAVTERYLRAKQPNAVITTGYNGRFNWATALTCKRLGIPSILYLVGWERERKRRQWKELVKRFYCRRYIDAAIVTGVRAEAYAKKLGVAESRIWKVGNVIDNDHFSTSPPLPGSMDDLQQPYFLTVSRLSQEKNIPTLLDAFQRYRSAGGTWHLAIAGTGPDAERLRDSLPSSFNDYVHWLGWTDYITLPLLYRHASCFILPSTIEPWGLVVNEAMAAGLPIVISYQCGCYPELCHEGKNGFGFSPFDVERLTKLMCHIASLSEDGRNQLGRDSSIIIDRFSLDSWCSAFVQAINAIVDSNSNNA